MAACHSTRAAHIPAVGYIRRSTSKQEASLADQRREIERYATAHGYELIRWYEDDGISGDSTAARRGFLAMHKAATNGRDFAAILCWDLSRFGRFDSLENGYWVHPLRAAGVKLVTVAEGEIAWDDFGGRVMATVQSEGKHSFLVDLSRNVCRSLSPVAEAGYLCGQAAPYGFDRMILDEHGAPRQRVHNGEQVTKPRSWKVKLVPSDDATKLSTARWLFTTYASTDTGLRGLADQLNARGVPGPRKGPWYAATIKAILENRNYVGTFTWAKRREGKYHRVQGGHVHARDRGEVRLSRKGKPLAVDNPQEAWIVCEGAHEALIDRATFDKVQAKLHTRRRAQPVGYSYRTHTKKNGDAFLLTGLVYCAHCGAKMHGDRWEHRKRGKVYHYAKYLCSTYARCGKNNPSGCGCHGAAQDTLVAVLVHKLREKLLGRGALERFKKTIRRGMEAKRPPDASRVNELRRTLADLDRDIEKAADNFLKAPADVLTLIGERLTGMKRQRQQLDAELRQAEADAKPRNIEAAVDAIAKGLWQLGEEIKKATPARRREVFREVVERIELRFDRVPRGKRTECPLRSGEIHLRTGEGSIFGSVSRGEPIFTLPKISFNRADIEAAAAKVA